jgi:hypothetical protein
MAATPEEGRAFLCSHREVFRGASDISTWMSRREIRRAVKTGNAAHLTVVVYDEATEWPSLCCPACSVGLHCLGTGWFPKIKWSEWHNSRSPVVPLPETERLVCPVVLDAKASGQVLH